MDDLKAGQKEVEFKQKDYMKSLLLAAKENVGKFTPKLNDLVRLDAKPILKRTISVDGRIEKRPFIKEIT